MSGQVECLHAHAFLRLPPISLCISEVKARPPTAGLSFYKLGLFVMHGGKNVMVSLLCSFIQTSLILGHRRE